MDDIILCRSVQNHQDLEVLNRLLDRRVDWEEEWQNVTGKCPVIRVTKAKANITSNYFLDNHQLEVVASTKYLGIIW